jgi:hypothetical protein
VALFIKRSKSLFRGTPMNNSNFWHSVASPTPEHGESNAPPQQQRTTHPHTHAAQHEAGHSGSPPLAFAGVRVLSALRRTVTTPEPHSPTRAGERRNKRERASTRPPPPVSVPFHPLSSLPPLSSPFELPLQLPSSARRCSPGPAKESGREILVRGLTRCLDLRAGAAGSSIGARSGGGRGKQSRAGRGVRRAAGRTWGSPPSSSRAAAAEAE